MTDMTDMIDSRDLTGLTVALRERVYKKLDEAEDTDTFNDVSDEELIRLINEELYRECRDKMLSVAQKEVLRDNVFFSIRGLDVLECMLSDDSITEIMVNGPGDIFIERAGRMERSSLRFESQKRLEDTAERIASRSNRIVNTRSPILDTRLENGSRVNIVLPPVAINGPVITIRKFYDNPLTIQDLLSMGSITGEAASFLENAVKARYNIFISGGTGSGKTTFLNILSEFIPADERVVTIEDSAELKLHNVDNLIRLEARGANTEDKNAVRIRDLIKTSLRMRPDRIIVGEVRADEAIDMLQAYNTGHDGSLSTGHANSAPDMMTRLETMVLMGMDMPVTAVRDQIAAALDIVVHLGRIRDKSRKVLEISEVRGVENGRVKLEPLFKFKEKGERNGVVIGSLERTQACLENKGKFEAAGIGI